MPTLEGTASWNASVGKCRSETVVVQLLSCVQLFGSPWTAAHQAPLSTWFSRQDYWSGNHFLLQGIFPTQGSNSHLLCLLVGGLSPQRVIYTIINFKKEHEGTETKAGNVPSVTICSGILTDHFSWVLTVSGLFSKTSLASSLLHSSSMHSLSRLPFFVSSSNEFARRLLTRTCEACCLDKTEGKKYMFTWTNLSFLL